jgi:hypothetical protein
MTVADCSSVITLPPECYLERVSIVIRQRKHGTYNGTQLECTANILVHYARVNADFERLALRDEDLPELELMRVARVNPCERHKVAVRARLVGPARARPRPCRGQ